MKINTTLLLVSVLSLLVSCNQTDSTELSVIREDYIEKEDTTIELFKLTNKNGMSIKVTNYAASLTYVSAPDKKGVFEPVVLGFDSLENYWGKHPKFGATVGRFANRIKDAEFCLNNRLYCLEKNNKGNSIHGGTQGFNRQVFKTDSFYVVKDTAIVVFKYISEHLEGGFPGTLNLTIIYKLTNNNEVILDYIASTDKATVLNLTNHSYFNLTGCRTSVLNHTFTINADSITPVDSTGIPTGELISVSGTEYDFTSPQLLARMIGKVAKGYDINYKLNKSSKAIEPAAMVVDSISGRVLKAYTTEPGMQFYVPASKMDYLIGHNGKRYDRYEGFCLEMQHFPDSPNKPHFPTTVLLPGDTYRQTTIYKFETIRE